MIIPSMIRKFRKYNKDRQFEVTNHSAHWKWRRGKVLSCSWCPPNQFENSNRRNRRYLRSWKDKTRREKQWQKQKEKAYPSG